MIFQQLKAKVENADKMRRAGEDLLFGNPDHAKEAKDKLMEADAAYDAARADANQMRKALGLRDELSADLPFLAMWLAALPSRGDATIEKLRQDAEALGDKLALLNRNLGEEQKAPTVDELAEIRRKFARAADRHQELCVALEIKSRAGLQQDWHDIDAVLRIPPLDVYDKTDVVKVRIGLLSGERGISGKLHVEKEAGGKIDADKREDRLDRNEKMLRACLKPYVENGDLLAPGRIADHAREFFLKQPAEIKQADGSDDEKMLLAAVECCRVVPGGLVDSLKNDLTESASTRPSGCGGCAPISSCNGSVSGQLTIIGSTRRRPLTMAPRHPPILTARAASSTRTSPKPWSMTRRKSKASWQKRGWRS